ncbi:tumor necrosis factor receptor superfamily member 5-like [Astyanax mexicanus]|uniref:Tumor necrosis factor receptor superfamily member 5-like n=1 Tax=Astyanax mexicanus TaxID=7994 RepID=A0A8T2LHG1_ASTMX|nr:tumor necrosis factor receptor superfamily member 5-like [Astyanax mexicanus]
MICSNVKILHIFIFFCLNFKLCYSACARAEYEINGYCCPMCAPGNRVSLDCTKFTSTTCVPCPNSTFLDAPNSRTLCFNCMECDPDKGLRVKTACTRASDAVCEPLQGYYCTKHHRGSCIKAKKHTKCQPGEFIQHIGTADRDAVCEKCGDGTFSDGSLQTCQPHSK